MFVCQTPAWEAVSEVGYGRLYVVVLYRVTDSTDVNRHSFMLGGGNCINTL